MPLTQRQLQAIQQIIQEEADSVRLGRQEAKGHLRRAKLNEAVETGPIRAYLATKDLDEDDLSTVNDALRALEDVSSLFYKTEWEGVIGDCEEVLYAVVDVAEAKLAARGGSELDPEEDDDGDM